MWVRTYREISFSSLGGTVTNFNEFFDSPFNCLNLPQYEPLSWMQVTLESENKSQTLLNLHFEIAKNRPLKLNNF